MKKLRFIFSNILFTFRYSWKISKLNFLLVAINIAVSSIKPFILLYIPKFIIDELTGSRRWQVVLWQIALYIGVLIFFFLFDMFWGRILERTKAKNNVKNHLLYANHFLGMDYEKFEDSTVRDLQERVVGNVQANNFVWNDYYNLTVNLLQFAGYTYIISTVHPLIILFILLITVLNLIIGYRREKIGYQYQVDTAQYGRKFNYLFDRMINFEFGKEIRINNVSQWLRKKFLKVLGDYTSVYNKNQNRHMKFNVLSAFITFVQTIVLYGYCAYKTIIGDITVGNFSVFLGAIHNFSDTLRGVIDQLEHLFVYVTRFVADYKQYTEIATPRHAEKGTVDIETKNFKQHEIEFVNVSFQYPNTENFVLKNVSIKITQGERLAIVGYNGAGKTTFIKLLCRLYEPTEGVILYNGIDISTINYAQYTELLSVVFQDYKLFAFSVWENITLGRKYNETKIMEAIEKSGLEAKIKSLEKGTETAISRDFDADGIEFSGGESQKLACAKAYYKDAPVVILDEPTAALDPVAENELYTRFNNIIGEKTTLYISHRLASVKFCDKVAVFADGRLTEYGTHQDLMQRQGLYADMYKKQAQFYMEEVPV